MIKLATQPRPLPALYVRMYDQIALTERGTAIVGPDQLDEAMATDRLRWWKVSSAQLVTDGAARPRLVEVSCALGASSPTLLVTLPSDREVYVREVVEVDPWDLAASSAPEGYVIREAVARQS